jgi:hypothetical protein
MKKARGAAPGPRWGLRPQTPIIAACAAVTLYFCLDVPARAQGRVIDRASLQAVGLFEHSCMDFAGFAGNLRIWVEGHHLSELPPNRAAQFLMNAPGKVYDASTRDGRLMLVSRDSGTCMVTMQFGDKDAVDAALQGVFRTGNYIVTRVSDQTSPDGKAKQTLDLVTLGKRAWHISTTTHARDEMPSALPTLMIMATATP